MEGIVHHHPALAARQVGVRERQCAMMDHLDDILLGLLLAFFLVVFLRDVYKGDKSDD